MAGPPLDTARTGSSALSKETAKRTQYRAGEYVWSLLPLDLLSLRIFHLFCGSAQQLTLSRSFLTGLCFCLRCSASFVDPPADKPRTRSGLPFRACLVVQPVLQSALPPREAQRHRSHRAMQAP
jgi:hypothetical protein